MANVGAAQKAVNVKMLIVKLSRKNLRIIGGKTKERAAEINGAIMMYNHNTLNQSIRQRISACNDLESLKLELVKILNVITLQAEINYPVTELLSYIENNIDDLECEEI